MTWQGTDNTQSARLRSMLTQRVDVHRINSGPTTVALMKPTVGRRFERRVYLLLKDDENAESETRNCSVDSDSKVRVYLPAVPGAIRGLRASLRTHVAIRALTGATRSERRLQMQSSLSRASILHE